MNYDATVLMGLAGMAVIALRVGWQIISGAKSDIELAAMHGLAQHEALKASILAARAHQDHLDAIKTRQVLAGEVHQLNNAVRMISKGRDTYGTVLESVTVDLGPRYRPMCGWCHTDLVVDSKGVCAGCGARP